MEKPIAGKPGNTLRSSYPHLLTIDRDKKRADKRGYDSVKNYKCPPGMERDEYPPKAFVENMGSAHIKCIDASDNRASGTSFKNQINAYRARPGAKTVRLDDGTVVEFVITE